MNLSKRYWVWGVIRMIPNEVKGHPTLGFFENKLVFSSGRGCLIGILTISTTYSSIIPRPTG